MSDSTYNVLESVANATASELILFFVLLAVVAVPLYIAVLKGRKEHKIHEREREKQAMGWQRQILDVIKENSTVIAGLKVTLDHSGEATKATLERIHTRIDEQNNAVKEVATDIAKFRVMFDNVIADNTEMASKINKILLIVDSMPNSSNLSTRNNSGQ